MTAEATTPSRQAASRIGRHLKSGLNNYVDHWQEWIAPTLVAGVTLLVAIFCCWFPYLIVVGPVTCGMYYCALKTMRGGSVEMADLRRGWHNPGRSIIAALVINLGLMLPFYLFYGLALAVLAVFITLVPEPHGTPNALAPPKPHEVVEAGSHADLSSGQPFEVEEPVRPPNVPPARLEQADEQAAQGEVRHPGQREKPSSAAVLAMIAGMCLFYAAMFLAIIAIWLWMLWFGTRTMFVLPLIADRRYSFPVAWQESWRETRTRFWELLIIHFVAGLVGMFGMYAMYVGLIFTTPIMFSILVAAYDERFPYSETIESKPSVGN